MTPGGRPSFCCRFFAGRTACNHSYALLASNMCTCFPPPSSSAAAAAAAAPASSEDVATLTRLTQELFTELVKVRARLDELEEETGIIAGSSGAAPPDATVVGSDGGSRRAKGLAVNGSGSGGQQQHARHRLAGVVRLGGGLMWAQVRRGL